MPLNAEFTTLFTLLTITGLNWIFSPNLPLHTTLLSYFLFASQYLSTPHALAFLLTPIHPSTLPSYFNNTDDCRRSLAKDMVKLTSQEHSNLTAKYWNYKTVPLLRNDRESLAFFSATIITHEAATGDVTTSRMHRQRSEPESDAACLVLSCARTAFP